MKDEVITLYKDYTSGKIKLKDIPLEKVNKMILIAASVMEPCEVSDVILELYKNNMFDSISLNLGLALSLIKEEYRNQTFFDKLFAINPCELFKHIPREYRSKEMCDKVLLLDPSLADSSLIPVKFRNYLMLKKMIKESDNIEVFKDIPVSSLDQELCDFAFSKFGISILDDIPDKFRTLRMYEYAAMNTKDWRIIFKIPRDFLTQDICSSIFFKCIIQNEGLDSCNVISCFESIPLEYRSTIMCKRMIEYSSDSEVLKLIPRDKLSLIICELALNRYEDESLEHIPDEFKTKQFYMDLLDRDFIKYVKYVPSKYYDLEMVSLIAIKLRKLRKDKNSIEIDKELCFELVKINPELIKLFSAEIRDEIIKRELFLLKDNGGTINRIAKIYKIDIKTINGVLEKIKESNLEDCDNIKRVLAENQDRYYLRMINDINNLYYIIGLFDGNKIPVFDKEQKIMFAYLYGRCIFNSLREIYEYCLKNTFNSMSVQDKALYTSMADKIVVFFKKYFKYNYVFESDATNIDSYEKNTILSNNNWIKRYKRENYIKILDGRVVTTRKYGKNEKELTLEIEEFVISKLRENNIPLRDIIVSNAFIEHFNGKLDEYIMKLNEYETYIVDMNDKRNGKKR